jgi:glycosyltransferase involved in cell wall biosynthesis
MEKMQKVSIIMPAYNVACFIKESILSIQNQTYKNWELLIINDGSTDDTLAVIEGLNHDDKRIQVYSQGNKGVSAARNWGVSLATGNFIAFLDGDDLWHPLFLNSMVQAILMTQRELAICGFNRLYPNGSLSGYSKQYIEGAIFLPTLKKQLVIHIGSILVSKELVERFSIRFTENCMISEDVEFLYKLLIVTEVAVVKKELMTYRKRFGSATQDAWKWEPYITSIYAMERVLEFTEKHYAKLDKDQVIIVLYDLIRYLKCDFLWKGLKFGEHILIRDLIDRGWRNDLKAIHTSETRFSKRLKYNIVLSTNSFLWNKIYYINTLINNIRQQYFGYKQYHKI